MSKTKRSLSAILAALVLLFVMPSGTVLVSTGAVWNGSVASGFASGSGTSSSPYVIANESQLAYLSSAVASGNSSLASAYYTLGADLYLNDVSDYLSWHIPVGSGDGVSDIVWYGSESSDDMVVPDNVWTPIGTAAHPFSGSFNGNGHFIRGLYCEQEGYAGLFGYNTGTVASVALYYSYVASTGDYTGGIVGYNAGTLSKLTNYGKVFSTGRYVGGIAGYSTGSISDAASYNVVSGGDVVGGIVGENFGGTVTRTLVTGSVSGENSVCATVGFSRAPSAVTNCYYKAGASESDSYGTSVSDPTLKSGSTVSGLGTTYWEYSSGLYPNVKGLPRESHVFSGAWTTDSSYHWHVCTDPGCETVSGYAAHSGGTATCTTLAICSVCGVTYGSLLPHALTHTAYAAPDHHHAGNIEYWYCSTCDRYFTDAGCTSVTTADALAIPMVAHSFSNVWSSDADNHWHACSCGDVADTAAHVYDDVCDTTCNVCGYVRTAPHAYGGYVRTREGHYRICSLCGTRESAGSHVYASVTDGVCRVCGYEREYGDGYGTDFEWGKLNVTSALFDVSNQTLTLEFESNITLTDASGITVRADRNGAGTAAHYASVSGNALTASFASVPEGNVFGVFIEAGTLTAPFVEADDMWIATTEWESSSGDSADAVMSFIADNFTVTSAAFDHVNYKATLTFSEPVTLVNGGQLFFTTRPNPSGVIKNGDDTVGTDQLSTRAVEYVDGFTGADGRTYAYTVVLRFYTPSPSVPFAYKFSGGVLTTANVDDGGIRIVEYIDSTDHNNGTISKKVIKSIYGTSLIANTRNGAVDCCWIPSETWQAAATAVGLYQAPLSGMSYDTLLEIVDPVKPVLLSAVVTDAAAGEVTLTFDLPVKLITDGLDGVTVSNGVTDLDASSGTYVTGSSAFSATQVIRFGADITGYDAYSVDVGYFYTEDNGYNAAASGSLEYPVDVLYGDADGDGDITAGDAALVLQKVASYDVEIDLAAADANGNGEIDAGDAAAILQYVAGYAVTLGPTE